MLLNCKEATRLVSQGLDRRLGLAERLALRLHLLICDGCTNFGKQAAFLRRALARLADR
jgi:ABC-type polysaccharide/polyol phosphate transport system ATPase subunit